MSNPKHPIITFRVKLERPLNEKIGPNTNQKDVNVLHPDLYSNSPDVGHSTDVQWRNGNKSTWLPGFLGGENVVVKDNDTIVAYGEKAAYLYRTYVGGNQDYLEVISITSESESS